MPIASRANKHNRGVGGYVRRRNLRQTHALAADGFLAPTPLEIAEGAAWMAWLAEPQNPLLEQAARELFFRVADANGGQPPTTRCPHCGVVLIGRLMTLPCAHCGKIGRLS